MRYVYSLAFLAALALIPACEHGPSGLDSDLDPLDTAQTRGNLLASDELLAYGSKLEWIPGTELVAFTTADYAIKTVDATNGNTAVVDGEWVTMFSHTESYFRRLVAAPDGSALYYTVGYGSAHTEHLLRVAATAGGDASTIRSVSWETALAISPDGRRLAFVTSDSLYVRDLASGVETLHANLPQGAFGAGPIVFSPDGGELLYEVREGTLLRALHRLSLNDGVDQLVSLPGTSRARLFRWNASGIEVLAEQSEQPDYIPGYHLLNLSTGESVGVGGIERGEGIPYEIMGSDHALSTDGTRVAYWIGRCLEWGEIFDCDLERWAMFVANTHTGARERVAYVPGSGPMVFSPDATRITYHLSEGDFYVVDVP